MSNTYFNISDKLRLYEFDGLLDQYGDAAAAYSLRKLRSGYTGSAIRVRRSSDNTERDMGFYDNELDTIALLDWVNEEINIADYNSIANVNGGIITKTADFTYNATSDGTSGSTTRPKITFLNAEEGCEFRLTIVPTNQSGTIDFKVYDGTSYVSSGISLNETYEVTFTAHPSLYVPPFISFDGNQIFNVDFTVELTALTSNGYVHTWYDQSANANHAVQGTATAQPKIVDAGAVVTEGGKPTILYDDVDDVLLLNSEVSTTDSFRHFIVADANADGRVYDSTSQKDSLLIQSYRYISRVNFINTIINSNTGYNKNIYQVGRNSSDEIDFVVNDSSLHSGTVITGESGISQIGSTTSIYGGTIYEVITYNSDVTISSLNSVGIRDNINNHYSIY